MSEQQECSYRRHIGRKIESSVMTAFFSKRKQRPSTTFGSFILDGSSGILRPDLYFYNGFDGWYVRDSITDGICIVA